MSPTELKLQAIEARASQNGPNDLCAQDRRFLIRRLKFVTMECKTWQTYADQVATSREWWRRKAYEMSGLWCKWFADGIERARVKLDLPPDFEPAEVPELLNTLLDLETEACAEKVMEMGRGMEPEVLAQILRMRKTG